MPDYKEMYFALFRAMEKAIRVLAEAQMNAEEMFLREADEEDEKKRD